MWYFTFGTDTENARYIVKINEENYYDARTKMFEMYGAGWAFQYGKEEAEKIIQRYGYKVIEVGC